MKEFKDRLTEINWRKLFLALLIGGMGGGLAHWANLPLAWMIGAMDATILASMANLPVAVPIGLRSSMLMVLGAFLGSTFTPDALNHIDRWPASLAAVILFVILVTGVSYLYYRLAARMDKVTALFSATPGGLTPMTVLGTACGGVEQQIALTQGLRVVLVVFLTPVFVYGILDMAPTVETVTDAEPIDLWDSLILFTGAMGGFLIARKLRIPAPQMTRSHADQRRSAYRWFGGKWITGHLAGYHLMDPWFCHRQPFRRYAIADPRPLLPACLP